MKLRLFALRDTKTNQVIPVTFFPNKAAAKKVRDELNAVAAGAPYVVTPGPDHRNFKG